MDELEKIAVIDTVKKMESCLLSISDSLRDLIYYMQLEVKDGN